MTIGGLNWDIRVSGGSIRGRAWSIRGRDTSIRVCDRTIRVRDTSIRVRGTSIRVHTKNGHLQGRRCTITRKQETKKPQPLRTVVFKI